MFLFYQITHKHIKLFSYMFLQRFHTKHAIQISAEEMTCIYRRNKSINKFLSFIDFSKKKEKQEMQKFHWNSHFYLPYLITLNPGTGIYNVIYYSSGYKAKQNEEFHNLLFTYFDILWIYVWIFILHRHLLLRLRKKYIYLSNLHVI